MSSPFLNPFVKATACSSCHSGPPGQYTASSNAFISCSPNTVCGKQVGGATRLLTGASRTVAGTCAACGANTYAADDYTDCQPNTVCGKQIDGSARLTGDSRTVAGSCAACAANTYAADDASDCTTPLSPSSKEEENLSPSSTEEENLSPSPSSTEEDDSVFDSDLNSAMKSNQNTSAVWFILFITMILSNFM